MTMQAELGELKAEKERLLHVVTQYGRMLGDLEKRMELLSTHATVKDRMLVYMAKGMQYTPQSLSTYLGVPLNTIHVTLKRHRKLFRRVERGLYVKA